MRVSSIVLPLLVAASGALAQINATYLEGLLEALSAAKLTQLSTVATSLANTSAGLQILGLLSDTANNYTVLAPSDAAFAAAPANVTSNATLLGDLLAYHILSGSIFSQNVSLTPNHTIARSVLNDSSVVQLEANKSQAVVLTATNSSSTPVVSILNQPGNYTVVSTSNYSNLLIHVIDGVLSLPPTLSAGASNLSLDALVAALEQANLIDSLESAHGITIFAPTTAALTAALTTLGSAAQNTTIIQTVLGNHVINGSTIYSTQLGSGNTFTSASGETFSFNSTANGTITVTSGNSTANIIRSDYLISNGVIHVIDGVLANTQSNPSAASSAYEKATSNAAGQPTQTGPVTSSSKGAAVSVIRGSSGVWGAAVIVAVVGSVAGGLLVL